MSPASLTLNHLLDGTVARVPDRVALVAESVSMTYSELQGKILRAATAFHGRGVRQGDRIAICLRNCPEFIIAYFGLVRLGAIVVPINFMTRKVPELQYMLQDCEAAGIVTQKEFLPGILEAKKSLPTLHSVWSTDSVDSQNGVASFQLLLANAGPKALPRASTDISGKQIASILYTSGTTGNPKGVMLSHANLVSNCDASIQALGPTERDVMLCLLPMFHTFAWTNCALLPFRLGMKTVITSSITPARPWLGMMAKHGVTIFVAIPPIYSVLIREAHGFQGLALRLWFFRKAWLCVSGAAPLSADVMTAFKKAFGVAIIEGYGLTETSPVATINPLNKPRLGSVGVPIPGVEIRIIDENEQPLPVGQAGEICIKGPNVMLGYYHKPQETRETFTQDGWFKTGDMGSLDADGYLFIRGRKKDMIIIKGLKVFAAQVEQIISANPLVEEVAVIGIPDSSGDEIIKAFVVLKPGVPADKTSKVSLMQFCREHLDTYKRPRDIEFLDSLPKNALQKVLKRTLQQQEIEKKQ